MAHLKAAQWDVKLCSPETRSANLRTTKGAFQSCSMGSQTPSPSNAKNEFEPRQSRASKVLNGISNPSLPSVKSKFETHQSRASKVLNGIPNPTALKHTERVPPRSSSKAQSRAPLLLHSAAQPFGAQQPRQPQEELHEPLEGVPESGPVRGGPLPHGPVVGQLRSGGLFGKKKQKYFGRQRRGLGGSGKTKMFISWKSDHHLFFSGDNQASARHAGNPGDKLEE